MNKIFKVVWSKVRNAYVVVSEIAKNTVSGVGKRNRIGKVSLTATLAASVLTSGFVMPNEVWAAVSALVDSKPAYYIAIGNAKTNVNPFGSNSDIVYDRTSGQRYINVVDGGETYKYIYTSVSVGGQTKYYWIREGFGVKAITERYHPEAANVKLDLYKIPGTNATYDNVAMSGEHSMVVSNVETAINKTKLDSVQYIQYAALSNSDGTGVPITYSYYIKRGEEYVDVGGGNGTNLKNNFYVFKDSEFNTLTGKYTFKGKDVEYDNVYNVGGKVGVFLTTSVNGVYDSNKTSNQLGTNVDVYGGTVYGLNNEVLLSGYNNTTKKWSTVWAAEITDPHATVESMTLGEFNEIMHHLHEEDVKLANEGIVKTKITPGFDTHLTDNNTISNGGSINLVNKAGNQVPGFTMQSLGGAVGNANDTYIRVKDVDGNYIDLKTGTVVVANDGAQYTGEVSLTSLTVNGNRYTISGGGINSDTTEIAGYYKPIVSGENQTLTWVWEKGSPSTTLTYGDLKGADGTDGTDGVDGEKGADGGSVYVTKTVQGRTTTLIFTNPNGTEETVELTDGQMPPEIVIGETYTVEADGKAEVKGIWNDSKTELKLDFYIPKGADGAGTGNASWNLKVGSETEGYVVDSTNNSVTLKPAEGEGNLSIVRNNGEVSFAMSKTPSFDSVTIGSSSDTSKVVINDNGIAMGNKKITGLAEGTTTTDAVNFGQLEAVKTALKSGDLHLVANPDVTGGKYTVTNNSVTLKVQGKDAAGNNVSNNIVIDDVASAEQVAYNTNNINSVIGGNVFRISTRPSDNTITLQRGEGTSAVVDSFVNITSSGGDGSDRVITFGTGNDAFSVDVGSVVTALTWEEVKKDGAVIERILTSFRINGEDYNLVNFEDIEAANNLHVSGTDGKKEYGDVDEDPNEKHGWTLYDTTKANITFVDTTLDSSATQAEEIKKDNDVVGHKYTIYDTAGNAVVLEDVASAQQVATNTTNIATNTTNIATNASDIEALDDRVTVNEGNISTNTSNITALSDRVTVNEGNISTNTSNITALSSRVSVNESNIATNTSNIIALDTRVTNNYNNSIKSIDVVSTNIGGTIGLSRNGDDVGNVPGTLTITRSGGSDGDNVNVTITNDGNTSGISLTTGTIVTANKHPNEGELLHSISVNGVQYKLPSYNQYTQMMSDLRLKEGGTSLKKYTNDQNDNRKGYVVDQQGIINLVVTDDNGVADDDINVYIANVARASDLGVVSEINPDGTGDVGELTNVSNHINNLYQQIAVEAANNTVVTSSDTNILVEPPNETNPGTYNVSLAGNISVDSVHAIEQITVGSGITLSGTDGVITAHAVNSDTVKSGLFEAGQTSMYNGYVSGLANTSWSPDVVYYGGYAATQEQLQEAVGYVNNNITKLKDNDIAEVRLSSNGNGGTVSLLRNIIIDGEHVAVPGTLSFASSGGIDSNKVITISSNGEVITLDAGSVVSANEGKAYVENQVQALEDITINGRKYSVATAASVEASKTVVQGSKDGVFSVTEVVANGAQHKTYNIDVNDMHVSGVQVTEGSNGKLNGTVAMKDNTTATITGLHDYYTTGTNVDVAANKATVQFNRNDGDNKYGFNIVGGSNIALGKDSDGAITISATDTNTQYKVEAANANKTVNVVNTYTFSEVDGNNSVQIVDTDTNTQVTGGSATYGNTGSDSIGSVNLVLNDGTTLSSAITGLKNYFTKNASLSNNLVTFTRNDGGTYTVDLSAFVDNWTAKVNGTDISVNDEGIINYVAGDNITLSAVANGNGNGGSVTVATAKEVAFDKVTVGNSDTVTNNIVISNTGIAMGNKSIGGLLGQDIVQGSTYAVTGGQLWNAMQQDIHSIKVTGGVNSGTVSLLRNALDSNGNNIIVNQPLTFSSSGGSGQYHPDTKITISDGTQTITLDTGSKVIGINNKDNALNDYHWNGTIEAIAINGMAYELGGISSGAYAEHDYHLVMEGADGVDLSSKYGSGYATNAQAYKADGNGVVTLDVQNNHDPNETGNYPARHVYIDDVASKEVLDGVSAQVEQNTKDIIKVNNRVSDVDNRVTQVDNRVSNLDSRVEQVNNRVSDVDNRVTQVDNRVSNLDSRVEQVNNRVSDVDNRVTQVNNRVSDVEQQVVQVDNRVSDVEQQVVQVNNRVTEVESNFITQGNIVEEDGSIELKNSKGDVKATVEGLSDYAIEARNDYKVNDGKVTLKIKDRFGGEDKEAVIHDVASATDLSNLTDAVGVAAKESLKDSYKVTTYLKDKVEDGTVTEKGAESLVEADVKLDKAIKDNADLSIQNDLTLQSMINNNAQYLDSRINQVNSRVNKVGAGAAALAALHPMDFDPDDKLSFAVGAGNYAGENATALGAFYRPNEKVMMNVAGTYGNGENMVNMGVSFALDRTNNVSNSRTAMAKEIVDLREQVATQGQQIAQLVALVQQLAGVQQPVVPAEQLFPDVPQNHWAYEYVNGLIAKGIIEGYPDGTFGGDRAMTRYEFAAMLFRAMEQGVVINEQVRQEFEKELGRIRVDRVKGTDADLNKIERVRVNTAIDRDDYGSKVVQVKH